MRNRLKNNKTGLVQLYRPPNRHCPSDDIYHDKLEGAEDGKEYMRQTRSPPNAGMGANESLHTSEEW